MIRQFKHGEVTWLDYTSPSKEELTELAKNYNLHSLVEAELAGPSTRARADYYDNYLFLILHFPRTGFAGEQEMPGADDVQEVDFLLGKNFIVTIHYSPIQVLDEFSQIFEANLNLDDAKRANHAGFMFFQIMLQLYHSLDGGLSLLTDKLKKVEKNIFNHKEKEMVMVLAGVNRELLDFHWALKSHPEALMALEGPLAELFGSDFKGYGRRIRQAHDRIFAQLENLREMFIELRDTNDSLLSIKSTEIMKILTIMAFITLPLSLIAAIFGMNTASTPIVGSSNDFWIILTVMLVALIAMIGFFRARRWM